ncbi:MAG: DUF2283 domain-containing protein [Methanobrevibacter sp.]|nr:DUF2283 domain-containing protein [Methanobrevibacter sp.]
MNKNNVVYDYDYQNDSLFIHCVDSYDYEVSLELDNDVILDLDINGKPVAFEFLNASKVFHLDKSYFKNLVKISIQSLIDEESIKLNVQLIVLVHNRNQVFNVNCIASNLNNIPSMETELVTA